MRGSRAIVNGKLIHRGRLWRRGRMMSERIGLIVIESRMTLRDIAFFYSQSCPSITPEYMDSGSWHHIPDLGYMVPIRREHLTHVIKGIRNTPRYAKAIEASWGLPIDEIRKIYREDKELETKGGQLSEEEINKFANWYRSVLKGKIAS
ncbi:hypothetical protein ACLK29_00720 [Leptospira kirschneri]|uniref:hypothetical protein n=1 Tax=Leptospira kirschneri TaxID=29507 RepID=UPI00398A9A4D